MLTDEEVRIKDASCMAVLTANVVLCVSVEGASRLASLLFHKKKIKKKNRWETGKSNLENIIMLMKKMSAVNSQLT